MKIIILPLITLMIIVGCTTPVTYEVIIRNGQLVDGSGNPAYTGDIAMNADTIASLGDLGNAKGKQEIDANGMVVAPGFINMLSWATESLIEDGNSESDIRQGVTLEVMGEGWSMGPWNDEMKEEQLAFQKDIKFN